MRQAVGNLTIVGFVVAAALAAPQGPTVVSGEVTVEARGAVTRITQGTERAILGWNRFGIG